jgi:hypothetical protein
VRERTGAEKTAGSRLTLSLIDESLATGRVGREPPEVNVMSISSRLFGRSEPLKSERKPRLGLEALEVPAGFVGGWGSSMYQYAYNDPAVARPADPMVSKLSAIKPDATPAAASDYLLQLDGIKGES